MELLQQSTWSGIIAQQVAAAAPAEYVETAASYPRLSPAIQSPEVGFTCVVLCRSVTGAATLPTRPLKATIVTLRFMQ
jgi:hypothetical protein